MKAPPHLTVDVGGVGYDIEAPMSTFYTLPALGSEIRLLTHLTVREDAHILYGFGTAGGTRAVPQSAEGVRSGAQDRAGHSVGRQRRRVRDLREAQGCGRSHEDSRRRPQDRGAVVSRDARSPRCGQRRGGRRRAGAERREQGRRRGLERAGGAWATNPPKSRRCSSRSPASPAPPKT